MNMVQYAGYGFADSDHLRKLEDPEPEISSQEDDEYEKNLLAKLESGEISQTQYETLTHTNAKDISYGENIQFVDMDAAKPPTPQEQMPQYQISATY